MYLKFKLLGWIQAGFGMFYTDAIQPAKIALGWA